MVQWKYLQSKQVIEEAEAEMAGEGRILVRPSGTEPLLRVMAEAPTDEKVDYYVDKIAAVVREEIGLDNIWSRDFSCDKSTSMILSKVSMNRFKIKKQSIFKFGKQILRLIAFFVGRVVQKRR